MDAYRNLGAWVHFAISGGGGGVGGVVGDFFGGWVRGSGTKEQISRFQTSRGWYLCKSHKLYIINMSFAPKNKKDVHKPPTTIKMKSNTLIL